ncbi:MAG: hypothetical protein ACRD7E_32985 [Bryobacteraceae bacterium]
MELQYKGVECKNCGKPLPMERMVPGSPAGLNPLMRPMRFRCVFCSVKQKYTAHDWKVVEIDWGKELRAAHQARAPRCLVPTVLH